LILPVGKVGTIVEIYEAEQTHYLVEVANFQRHEDAMAVFKADELLALHCELARV